MIVKTWNCTGLANKVKKRFFRKWLTDTDIASIQETLLPDGAAQFPGFVHFLRPASYGSGGKKYPQGGLASLGSSQLTSTFNVSRTEELEFDGLECLSLHFQRKGDRSDLPSDFLVLNVYIVTQPSSFDFDAFYFALEAFLSAFDCPVIILGDFNAHLRVRHSVLPNATDRDFQEFMLRAGDTGFSHFPSGADLDRPTFISDRECTVIDYVMIRGAPCSGFTLEDLTPKGHRSLRISVDWPNTTLTEVREHRSFWKHFRAMPPSDFFGGFSVVHGLRSVHDFIRFGLSRVFQLFVLTLGIHFVVSHGPKERSCSEPWYRYLSEAELRPLLSLESEVADLLAKAHLGPAPAGLTERATFLRQLLHSLYSRATEGLFGDVKGSLDDPTRLWALVKRFRVSSEQGALPIDTLVHNFSAVFNRASDPVPVVFVGRHPIEIDSLDRSFDLDKLEAAMRELSRGTAPGGTGIGKDILLDLFKIPGAPDFFLNLFNACLEGTELPSLWRCTEIFLLYKGRGGSRTRVRTEGLLSWIVVSRCTRDFCTPAWLRGQPPMTSFLIVSLASGRVLVH